MYIVLTVKYERYLGKLYFIVERTMCNSTMYFFSVRDLLQANRERLSGDLALDIFFLLRNLFVLTVNCGSLLAPGGSIDIALELMIYLGV